MTSPHLSDDVFAYEEDKLSDEETVALFQKLIDDGTAWKLQGHYGRTAMALIESGQCTLGPTGHRDYYGNYVPSRFEVKQGTKGSAEFAARNRSEDS